MAWEQMAMNAFITLAGPGLMGDTPALVIGQRAVWRVPALLTSPSRGVIGQAGSVDIDATSGKVLANPLLIQESAPMPNALPVPLHRQSEGDCLPVCVQMVLAYRGLPGDRQDLITQLGTDPDVGTPASRVLRLQSSTLSATYQRADEHELCPWISQRVPVIMLVDTAQLPYWSRRCLFVLCSP
jgi:hypothetical protein